ncbi:hypothetical protein FB45DRAFT_1052582 [Roridomyces roridus]|uniref:MYND-type domain-containing protein n=1 Tax=Roridomyces roridus TaxID=1738132 RepID=A0AAD7FWQ9_9AGAR|nr:hypothetical protein FB45DRAFT_1052582 [Roridomyces roridus]
MHPRETRLRNFALRKYGYPDPDGLSEPELRAQFILQLTIFMGPCGSAETIWGPVTELENLAATLSAIPTELNLGAPRKVPIRDAWNDIFESEIVTTGRLDDVRRWIEFLYGVGSDFPSIGHPRISMVARGIVLGSIVNFLAACLKLQDSSLRHWINKHGALGFLGNIWCLQAEWGLALPVPTEKSIGETLHFALLCWARDMYDTVDRYPPFSEELARQTKKDMHELAYAALAHLIRDCAEREDRTATVADTLVILLLDGDAMHPSFVARNAVRYTTRAMARVIRPRHPLQDGMSVDVLHSGCNHLSSCISRGDGLSSIIRAFEAGFLSSFLVGFDPASHARLLPLLQRELPTYLVHLPVVRSAAKALRKIRRNSTERRMDRRSPIWDAWSDFKKLLEQRIELAESAIYLVCASKLCNRVDYKDDCLQYCVGCMGRAYCSTECQRRDWVTGGHRAYCKEIRAQRLEGKKIKLSEENKDYISLVLEKDRKSFAVLEMMHRTKRLAVEFDYTTAPFKIFPCETLEAQPSYTLVQLKLPGGKHSHLLRVKLPMPKGLADSITGKGMGPEADQFFYQTSS